MRFYLLSLAVSTLLAACTLPGETEEVQPASQSAEVQETASPAAHRTNHVRHIGNAGLLIQQGDTKILFDPLYRNSYNNYHLVPEQVKAAVLAGKAPFDEIDAILISHAHGDHFDAEDIITFHENNPRALIVGPTQALQAIKDTGKETNEMQNRYVPMGLEYGQDPLKVSFGDLLVEAVRIPHAGGAGRRDIENLVYRVTLEEAATVMHMGDADPALEHYTPYTEHWQARKTDAAFPPYWLFLSAEGISVVDDTLNAKTAIGLHVPVRVPADLAASGRDFFGEPGGVRELPAD